MGQVTLPVFDGHLVGQYPQPGLADAHNPQFVTDACFVLGPGINLIDTLATRRRLGSKYPYHHDKILGSIISLQQGADDLLASAREDQNKVAHIPGASRGPWR